MATPPNAPAGRASAGGGSGTSAPGPGRGETAVSGVSEAGGVGSRGELLVPGEAAGGLTCRLCLGRLSPGQVRGCSARMAVAGSSGGEAECVGRWVPSAGLLALKRGAGAVPGPPGGAEGRPRGWAAPAPTGLGSVF